MPKDKIKPAKKVDKSKALKLRLENRLTYQEIADNMQVTKQAIHTALRDLLPKEETKTYIEHRADILANVQIKQLEAFNSLTSDEQKDLIKRRGLVDYGIVYDKEVLARGGSLNADARPLITITMRCPPPTQANDTIIDIDTGNHAPKQVVYEVDDKDTGEGI